MLLMNQADAQIKIGTNGSIISPSSLLELESANQGLLLPRLADTAAINALSPPNGMLIYLTKSPAVGLYVRKVNGWEYITGSLAGNGNFNSLTVANAVTAGSFSGPLNGNATTATLAATATNSLNSAITNDLATSTITYPTFVTTTPGNSPLRTSNTNLSYVPSTGILTAKGFNGPLVGNVTGTSTLAIDATNAANTAITNDVTTNAVHYPTFVTGTTGNLPQKTSNANLTFNPNTGILTAIGFIGNLTGSAPAGLLTGNTLNSTVLSSSLTQVGTLTAGTWNAGNVTTYQLRGKTANGLPTVVLGTAAGGAGAGSVISGNDLAGQISITIGAAPAASGTVATITYANLPSFTDSFPVLYPANAAAAGQSNIIFSDGNATSFTISTSGPLGSPATYTWNYHVIGN